MRTVFSNIFEGVLLLHLLARQQIDFITWGPIDRIVSVRIVKASEFGWQWVLLYLLSSTQSYQLNVKVKIISTPYNNQIRPFRIKLLLSLLQCVIIRNNTIPKHRSKAFAEAETTYK